MSGTMVNHNSRATPIYKNKYPASLINHYRTYSRRRSRSLDLLYSYYRYLYYSIVCKAYYFTFNNFLNRLRYGDEKIY